MLSLASGVFLGSDSVTVPRTMIRCERLGIDVMASVKSAAPGGLGQKAEISAEEGAFMPTMAKEDFKAFKPPVRQVTVSMEILSA